MTKEAQKVAEQIKNLVDQLAAMSIRQPGNQKFFPEVGKEATKKKGAAGALSILRDEGFFDKPQDLAAVMSRLEQVGHYHPKSTVAMNLLNLTKRRTFSRIKDNKTKQWQYVLRK